MPEETGMIDTNAKNGGIAMTGDRQTIIEIPTTVEDQTVTVDR
jgi:hypothetical protein